MRLTPYLKPFRAVFALVLTLTVPDICFRSVPTLQQDGTSLTQHRKGHQVATTCFMPSRFAGSRPTWRPSDPTAKLRVLPAALARIPEWSARDTQNRAAPRGRCGSTHLLSLYCRLMI